MATHITWLLGLTLLVAVVQSTPTEEGEAELRGLVNRLQRVLDEKRQHGDRSSRVQGNPVQQTFSVYNEDLDQDETYVVDLDKDKQVLTADSGDSKGSKLVIDGTKNVLSWYSTVTGECYLVGGVDANVPSAQETAQHGNGQGSIVRNKVLYAKVNDRTVNDPSLLSEELQEVCADKPIFWLRTVGVVPSQQGLLRKRSWLGDVGKIAVQTCILVACYG